MSMQATVGAITPIRLTVILAGGYHPPTQTAPLRRPPSEAALPKTFRVFLLLSARSTFRRWSTTAVGVFGLCTIGVAPSSAQFLQTVLHGVRTPKATSMVGSTSPEQPAQTRKQFNRERRRSQSDDDWDLGLVVGLIATPIWAPRVLAEDNGCPASFCTYPYEEADDVGIISRYWLESLGRKSWMSRVRCDYADDFDDLSKIGGQLLIDSTSRLGFETEFSRFREDFLSGVDDSLWLGDANWVYRFAQSERLQMRTGIGFNWLVDDTDSEFGINFTYGGDWFPIRPLVVSTEFDFGRIGHASLFHGRASIGVQLKHTELFVGFDYLDIRDAQAGSIVTGLRFWF